MQKGQESFSGSEVNCIIDHEGFESVCLNVWVLQTAYFAYRYHYGEVGGLTHEWVNVYDCDMLTLSRNLLFMKGDIDLFHTVSWQGGVGGGSGEK